MVRPIKGGAPKHAAAVQQAPQTKKKTEVLQIRDKVSSFVTKDRLGSGKIPTFSNRPTQDSKRVSGAIKNKLK